MAKEMVTAVQFTCDRCSRTLLDDTNRLTKETPYPKDWHEHKFLEWQRGRGIGESCWLCPSCHETLTEMFDKFWEN